MASGNLNLSPLPALDVITQVDQVMQGPEFQSQLNTLTESYR